MALTRHHLDRVPGFLEFHLLRGPERDDHVLYSSHTVWASKEAFTAWTQSEHFRAAHRDAGADKPLYLGHPEFEGFEVLQRSGIRMRGMRPPEPRPVAFAIGAMGLASRSRWRQRGTTLLLRGEGGAKRRMREPSRRDYPPAEQRGQRRSEVSLVLVSSPEREKEAGAASVTQRHTTNALSAFASSARSGPFIASVASPIANLMLLS